jgi:hypothetical protein
MALDGTMVKIQTVTVGSGGAANIEFTNIPQTYTDLKIVMSGRIVSGTDGTLTPSFNNSTANFSYRRLIGDGASASSYADTTNSIGYVERSDFTASTFSNTEIYIPNYTGSTNKSFSVESVMENNATTSYAGMWAGLWSNTAAITSVKLSGVANLAQHSTATLYGISRTTAQIKATGGMVYDDASYVYHVFRNSGTFIPAQNLNCDLLVIAGGGGGATRGGGGGGAGGYLEGTSSLTSGTSYAITIGAGGAGGPNDGGNGTSGTNTTFGAVTANGGGGGNHSGNGTSGGSGGGAGYIGGTGGAATQTSSSGLTGYGFAGGGNSFNNNANGSSGGGGGAGGIGGSPTALNQSGGVGGVGRSSLSSWGLATGTGQLSSGTYYYAGGGGGCAAQSTTNTGGLGGGGIGGDAYTATGGSTSGTANTGGGGGGGVITGTAYQASAGGSGIVIVRYAK